MADCAVGVGACPACRLSSYCANIYVNKQNALCAQCCLYYISKRHTTNGPKLSKERTQPNRKQQAGGQEASGGAGEERA